MKLIKIYLMRFFLLLTFTSLQASKYVIGHWSGGMGICLTSTLNHLLYCEHSNLTPVVYWYKSLYHEPSGFNGKQNEWDYYFLPVSALSYNNGDIVNYFCMHQADCGHFSYYDTSNEKRNLAHQLINKYVIPNSIVKTKIDQFYNKYMVGKQTIAIHIRGTDKQFEEKPVPPSIIVAEALKYADQNTQFFIATDEQKLLNGMLELLQGRDVIYYDCYRSDDGKPLHHKKPKPSIAQLGEDVIVEMWLMSKCDMLLHTLSNVSSIPLYVNPRLNHIIVR